jgi:AcrR family transcriptional regulator
MQDTRLRICAAALNLFLEQGYDNTALSQIAKASGITKAGLYHYFPNKEVLLYEVHKMHVEKNFLPLLDEIERIPDPSARIELFMRHYISLMTKDPYAKLLIQEAKRLDDDHAEEIKEAWKRAYHIVHVSLTELQMSGRHKRLNVPFAALSMIGMMTWILYWFDYSRQDSVEELTKNFLEIFLHGVERPPQ